MKTLTSVFLVVATLTICAATALAQPLPKPVFEVAAIKPIDEDQIRTPGFSTGMTVTAQQVTIRLPLAQLIETAYEIRPGGVEGPDWLVHPKSYAEGGVFEISAKLPEGATGSQIPLMLRTLLADRFKLSAHMESRQASVYALTVGKNGPKLQPKEASGEADQPLNKALDTNGLQVGGAKITRGTEGSMTIEASNPSGLSYMLSTIIDTVPVVDRTNIKGSFDIKLEIPYLVSEAEAQKDLILPGLDRLGLKLEQRKDQVDTLVVDHIEKVPTGN